MPTFFSTVPSFDKDFLVMIQDWQQMNIVPKYHASVYKFDDYLKNGFDADTCTKHDTATVINGIGEESIIITIIIIIITINLCFWVCLSVCLFVFATIPKELYRSF